MRLEMPLAVFRPNFWPIFGQTFGRFSAKLLDVFRPKVWPVFVQNLVRFSAKEPPSPPSPPSLGKLPFGTPLTVTRFYGRPSQISRERFPNLRPKLSFFSRKLKTETKSGHDFVTKIVHKKVEAEGPRLRARSHSVLPVYVFRHDFLTIFVHDFGPRFVAEISRKLKTKNGKRIQFLPKNGQSFGRKTDNKTKSGQFFGRKTDKVLAENWPNFWPKIVQKFGRKAAKSLAENRTSFLSKDGHDASPGAPPRRSKCIALETV